MKIHFLIESEQESAEREANLKCELFRGISEPIHTLEMVRLPIRTDRRPRDSTYLNQLLFNAAFEMVHGIKDVRTRSMFCLGDFDYAQSYSQPDDSGNMPVLSVYPLNSSKCAFNEHLNDSIEFIQQIGAEFSSGIETIFDQSERKNNALAALQELHTGSVTNCLEQFNGFINTIKKLCEPRQISDVDELVTSLKQALSDYQIVPGSRAHELNGIVEVMVFDAAYYYAKTAEE